MSWVTDVLLLLNLDEIFDMSDEDEEEIPEEITSQALTNVNNWLLEGGFGQLVGLHEYAFKAGNKAMLSLVYGGAFNYLDADEFINVINQQNWHSPKDVQLLLKSEGEPRFNLYTIKQSS